MHHNLHLIPNNYAFQHINIKIYKTSHDMSAVETRWTHYDCSQTVDTLIFEMQSMY